MKSGDIIELPNGEYGISDTRRTDDSFIVYPIRDKMIIHCNIEILNKILEHEYLMDIFNLYVNKVLASEHYEITFKKKWGY